ncbi:MAG TPA: hypothetical protein VK806_13290 [Bacteroidia bacterium]|nr:hypothetical protein [Bacteroidia bacterium]
MAYWKLKGRIDAMYRAFEKIVQKYQKRSKRGKGIKLIGFKTLECEFNDTHWTYNPHFNILVPNKEIGEILKTEWLDLWGKRYATEDHQYCERVYSKEKILLEVIKYCTKVFTDPDKDKSLKNRPAPKMYLAAQYHIYKAMKGHRIFDRFGFNLPKKNEPKGGTRKIVANYINWKYDPKYFDWVGEDTDGMLTNYTPEARLLYILEHCIDILLE